MRIVHGTHARTAVALCGPACSALPLARTRGRSGHTPNALTCPGANGDAPTVATAPVRFFLIRFIVPTGRCLWRAPPVPDSRCLLGREESAPRSRRFSSMGGRSVINDSKCGRCREGRGKMRLTLRAAASALGRATASRALQVPRGNSSASVAVDEKQAVLVLTVPRAGSWPRGRVASRQRGRGARADAGTPAGGVRPA